jgi:putative FmdB family regulatory protein
LSDCGRIFDLPLYEYRCVKCKTLVEKIEKFSGPHLKRCPHCGGKMELQLSAPAIQFRGTGWYVTDYGRKTSGGDSAKPGKPEKSETKADAPSKEGKKPAAAPKEK